MIDVNPLIIYCFVGVASSLVAFYTSRFFFGTKGRGEGRMPKTIFHFLPPEKENAIKSVSLHSLKGKAFALC